MEIILRIIALPFFAVSSLFAAFFLWLKWMYNFARYGGEAIAYTSKTRRKTIQDVFELIKKHHETDTSRQ